MATPARISVRALSVFVICAALGSCVSRQEDVNRRSCHAYDNSCRLCIQTPGCNWCSDFVKKNLTHLHRCFSSNNNQPDYKCSSFQLDNPENSEEIIKNENLTVPRDGKNNGTIIQLAPQKIHLKLRKGVPYDVKFKFRLATDYPIDLYYLMDHSKSMKDDKIHLARLGGKLAETMRNLTTQFRLGFGSFVDKVVMPYTNVHPEKIAKPCPDCDPPYSFINNLPLDTDATKFTDSVRNTKISANVDAPEGGLDALMQAIVCWKEIGWREDARRILILSTDAKFHHAGDGKLAGIVQPHDSKCYLDKEGRYTEYHRLDYPSIAQIDQASRDNKIYIIFAISNFLTLYEKLSHEILYSSYGLLNRDSTNVVELVVDQYNKLSSKVILSDTVSSMPGTPLSVRYFALCPNASKLVQQNSCNGVREGNEIEFTAEVELVNLPPDYDQNKTNSLSFNITTLQDTITVDVEILAECGCQRDGIEGPDICTGAGTMQCGVCECSGGNYGNDCQCSLDTETTDVQSNDTSQCLADPTSPVECSGFGICECGMCICSSDSLSGKHCECNKDHCYRGISSSRSDNDYSSSQGGDNECSGRGTCDCGECSCRPGWTGTHCECPDNESCKVPGSSEVCSGKGVCECGHCSCPQEHIENILYTGRYCEECSTCSSGKCTQFKDCVQCNTHESGELAGDKCKNCTSKPNYTLNSLEKQIADGAKLCTFSDESTGCDFNFTYEYQPQSQNYLIMAQKYQLCPEELDVLGVILGVIGGVVAVGLLTLILWKILTTIHDRREFAKFEEERKNVHFGTQTSPYYKPATGTFVNPAFSQTTK